MTALMMLLKILVLTLPKLSINSRSKFKHHFAEFVTSNQDRHNFNQILHQLEDAQPLPEKFHDHQLRHQRKGVRNFHLQNDLVIVYCRIVNQSIDFIDIGSRQRIYDHKAKF